MPNLNVGSLSSISIILPCYNERENLVELIGCIDKLFDSPFTCEMIVVDDNSKDGTYDAVCALSNKRVKAILRKAEPSLAGSILDGILASTGEIIVVMDTDFNHDPKYLPFMVDNIKYWDCVTGSRFQYGGGMESESRTIFSWIFNVFTRVATGGKVTDNLYGYYAIKRSTLFENNLLRPEIFSGYGNYFIKRMFYLQRLNITILQFPALNGLRRYGQGNTKFIGVLLQYTMDVLKLTFRDRVFAHVQKNRKL